MSVVLGGTDGASEHEKSLLNQRTPSTHVLSTCKKLHENEACTPCGMSLEFLEYRLVRAASLPSGQNAFFASVP